MFFDEQVEHITSMALAVDGNNKEANSYYGNVLLILAKA